MSPLIEKNVPLAHLTTLGVGGSAEYFAAVTTREALKEVVQSAQLHSMPITVLAGGSNVLIRDEGIRGLVIRPQFLGSTFEAHDTSMEVTVGAGVVLDDLVSLLVEKKVWGLENLSHIPGTVGAVPVQNVGAYGVEAGDIVHHVSVYNIEDDMFEDISAHDCAFGYRDSIFKRPEGKKYIIISVTFSLSTVPNPRITYRDLHEYFTDQSSPDIASIRNAVVSIRSKKFPDWHSVGTAGSFFKNPIVHEEVYAQLQEQYTDVPGYRMEDGRVKISLGWILDKVLHLKGYREGNVGLYAAQALVLTCTKGIKAEEVEKFSDDIIRRVQEKIGITVEREVTLLG